MNSDSDRFKNKTEVKPCQATPYRIMNMVSTLVGASYILPQTVTKAKLQSG